MCDILVKSECNSFSAMFLKQFALVTSATSFCVSFSCSLSEASLFSIRLEGIVFRLQRQDVVQLGIHPLGEFCRDFWRAVLHKVVHVRVNWAIKRKLLLFKFCLDLFKTLGVRVLDLCTTFFCCSGFVQMCLSVVQICFRVFQNVFKCCLASSLRSVSSCWVVWVVMVCVLCVMCGVVSRVAGRVVSGVV